MSKNPDIKKNISILNNEVWMKVTYILYLNFLRKVPIWLSRLAFDYLAPVVLFKREDIKVQPPTENRRDSNLYGTDVCGIQVNIKASLICNANCWQKRDVVLKCINFPMYFTNDIKIVKKYAKLNEVNSIDLCGTLENLFIYL